jgi:glutamyl-tRNA synthetase
LLDRAFAWRLRVPSGLVEWDDLFLGRVSLDPAQLGGDFIVARNGAGYSYQLAVVADDAAMGVTQVIRGTDLVPSTPRQILLYRQAGCPLPHFGHVALALEPGGRRLAKRDGSLKLATLREKGVDPHVLIGALVHSCGWTQAATAISAREAIGLFNPHSLWRDPWIVKLEWLHGLSGPSNS